MKPGRLSGLTEGQKDYGMNCSPYKLLHVKFLSADEYGNILQSQIWSETNSFFCTGGQCGKSSSDLASRYW